MQALKVLVIFMGVLIIVGMGLVAYGIAVKFGRVAERAEGPVATATGLAWSEDVRIRIPPGARVADVTLDDGRMVVRVMLADGGAMLLLFDPDTGTRLGRLELVPEGEAQ